MKHKLHDCYAITISPRPDTVTLDQLDVLANKYCTSKTIEKYAYALELGNSGNHPHLHMLCNYITTKRLDSLKLSLKRFVLKNLDHESTPKLVYISKAHKPLYFLQTYMQKEGIRFLNKGYDFVALKANEMTEKKRIFKMGHELIKLNRDNFLPLYLEVKDKIDSKYTPITTDYISDLIKYFTLNGFSIGYILHSPRQVETIIQYVHGYELTNYFLKP